MNPNHVYSHTQSRDIIFISTVILLVAAAPVREPWYALILAEKRKLTCATIIAYMQVYILHVETLMDMWSIYLPS
jgi:hypothetical protein